MIIYIYIKLYIYTHIYIFKKLQNFKKEFKEFAKDGHNGRQTVIILKD